MKERPILFSASMVRAILGGSKTQTRRAVKGRALEWLNVHNFEPEFVASPGNDLCPYGQPGSKLWVREAFDFLPAGAPDQPQACEIVYWATGSAEQRTAPHDYNPMIYGHEKVRPSIHMPRWASRITLEIVSVRVERLQDISEGDATAEGCKNSLSLPGGRFANENYRWLWEEINGDGSWDTNPWVWVVEFRRIEA